MAKESIGRWISLLYRYSQIYVSKKLEPYNIGTGQFLFLLALYHQDGLPQEKLAHYLNMDKGTTARAIDKLEKAGYVIRKTNEQDRRSNKVFLTEQGLSFKPTLYSILQEWTEIICKGLTEEEVERTLHTLIRMAENAADYIHQKCK
ncbi:DNA-binding MarR family transcriptional regulator [Caldalkalibacillus uzonensis]|uniref:DNA-binding MarR family transcriptional regulator n=1 Tax=Caldalkalibacillus uzonensis TaxID=353224 RepID=A0ABU0CQ77_9BACI|nr:MarR family transcriptional regulator [Caldalkalibacillus uzonensis]MDQ0338556.1 DNA-binding MarR family transcriptional regulator [Caldalkalibacillus uzonensis]